MLSKSLVLQGSSGSGDDSSSCSALANFADRMRLDFLVGSKSSSVGATLKVIQEEEKTLKLLQKI